jgi:hypothetical protein
MKKFAILLVFGVLFSGSAYATITSVSFDLYGVNYAGIETKVDFSYDGVNKATITLDNTSSINSILTAFAFNVPSNVIGASLSYTGVDAGTWALAFSPDNIDLPQPFGLFDVGAYTVPLFKGGDPKNGIYEGDDATFYLTFAGSGLDSLTANSFFSLLSYEEKQNDYPVNFIARYQGVGLGREGSDVGVVVPEPSTFVLLGMGIAGMAFLSRRKKNS